MSQEESLRELLARVHERLNQTSAIDSESRVMLKTVMRDIERALGGSAAISDGHTTRLEALAVQFEAEHPQLADTLRQLIDSLGKAGI